MKKSLTENESGVALVTAILVIMLASGLMAGMFAALLANQRSHATDRDQSVAYAAAHAGLEKLTAGLAQLFITDFSPSAAQLGIVDNTPPAIAGFEYTKPGGLVGSGYEISFTADPGPGPNTGNPLAFASADITTGPFEGFKGLITPYTLTVTAKSVTGNSEVRLRRELQTVAVPVFQFGIFGEKSLGFHAGPNFDFGGRVHTNESLHIAAGNGSTLTFRDKITAFYQVKRNTLLNGVSITLTNHAGTVSIPTVIGGAPATYRNLADTENSGTTVAPWAGWKNLSEVTYRTNIRTETTGAKKLTLPIVTADTTPIDLLRRPPTANEDVANPVVYGQRYYAQASLRIMLSDRAADLTGLPTATLAAPLQFDAAGGLAGYVVAAGAPPVAMSPGFTTVNNLQQDPIYAVDGTSLTRVSAVNALAVGQLTIQTQSAPPGGAWNTNANVACPVGGPCSGVPPWLRQSVTVPAVPAWWPGLARSAVAAPFLGNLACTGLAVGQLLGCRTNVVPTNANRHPAYAAGSPITITRGDGTTFVVNTVGANLADTGGAQGDVINVNLTAAQIAQAYAFSRVFFVGEDPVTCTGFSRQPAVIDAVPNMLTGCTLPGNSPLTTAAPGTGIAVNDPVYSGATTPVNTPLLNGFIKIEKQNAAGVWSDVTLELLQYGFAGPNQQGDPCADPTPNAVLRFQRLRDNGLSGVNPSQCAVAANNYSASLVATNFVPNMLFDAREGNSRTLALNAGMNFGGLFSYVALDVNNLKRWLSGAAPYAAGTGNQVLNNNGYIIYFSDRRGDHNEVFVANPETGEYGNEDSINPGAAAFATNAVLDAGEDFNESTTLQTYGATPSAVAGVVPAGALSSTSAVDTSNDFDATQRPWSTVPLPYTGRARLARPVLFRRALKLINGGLNAGVNSLPTSGLTVTTENPVYIQGNYNATAASVVAEPNVPAAVIGDSITLLSNGFNDAMTFQYPNDAANRPALDTGYRFAMVTGKTIPFPKPAWSAVQEMGSDGGVHNFMKMLENWNPGAGQRTLRYRGSMVSLYYSRQAVGIYRADGNIYGAPLRAFNFDTDFLTPALLPPGTPMFRDINTLKFRQILRPNQ